MHRKPGKWYSSLIMILAVGIFPIQAGAATRSLANSPVDSASLPVSSFSKQTKTPNYPSQEVDTRVLINDVNNLPLCPGDPYFRRSGIAVPKCTNINEEWTDSKITYYSGDITNTRESTLNINPTLISSVIESYCPKLCRTTRLIETTGSTITRVILPVCPDGYAQVGVANADRDVDYVALRTYAPYPIKSMADYDGYVKSGYICYTRASGQLIKFCGVAGTSTMSGLTPYDPRGYGFDFSKNYSLNASLTEYRTPIALLSDGNVGLYYDFTNYHYCYTVNCAYLSTASGCLSPSSLYSRYYKYSKGYVRCYRDPGFYYSDAYIPTTLICARIHDKWGQ